jgi:hypothetical protein
MLDSIPMNAHSVASLFPSGGAREPSGRSPSCGIGEPMLDSIRVILVGHGRPPGAAELRAARRGLRGHSGSGPHRRCQEQPQEGVPVCRRTSAGHAPCVLALSYVSFLG